MERVSLDELDSCMRQLTKSLGAAAASGGPLPRCLVIRLVAPAAEEAVTDIVTDISGGVAGVCRRDE